ncbi:MAG: radical SAM protein [Deltaproteobacteria bacterium]|nr:MAG: radical SAM protein [Deltaproteobacteria bacterium]
MRYEGDIYRPPSEADAYILQATIGCSWNACTYCAMYRDKRFRVRELSESLQDLNTVARLAKDRVTKVFVADGDALTMDLDHWLPILDAAREGLPRLKRVSCYAMARNVAAKSDAELRRLAEAGLTRLYIGPESGDEQVLKEIAKGDGFDLHVEAAQRAKAAGMEVSAIFLLGAGGVARSEAHAEGSARLATAMDPEFLAALTLTVVPGTPLAKRVERDRFELPDTPGLLRELRTFVDLARPTDALFRTNHASNYLPIGGRLPADRERILAIVDAALDGKIPLRPESHRGL